VQASESKTEALSEPAPVETPLAEPTPPVAEEVKTPAPPNPKAEAAAAIPALEAEASKHRTFRMGFYLAPIEIPRPLTIGVEGRVFDRFGLSLQKSFVPRISFDAIQGKFDSFEVRPRWYPLRGAFHIGLGYGYLSLSGSKTDIIASESVTVTAEAVAKFIAPTIGWTWGAQSGFFYGIDLGAQFTLSAKTSVTSASGSAAVQNSQAFKDFAASTEADANKTLEPLTKYVVPVIGLVKIGWMF
jgi:hypothetical protein